MSRASKRESSARRLKRSYLARQFFEVRSLAGARRSSRSNAAMASSRVNIFLVAMASAEAQEVRRSGPPGGIPSRIGRVSRARHWRLEELGAVIAVIIETMRRRTGISSRIACIDLATGGTCSQMVVAADQHESTLHVHGIRQPRRAM